MAYDLPNATHMERGITGIFEYGNTVSDGLFIPLFVLALWIIIFSGSRGATKDTPGSIIVSSFICGVIGVPLALLGLFAVKWMFLLGLMIGIGVFWSSMEK